jgi:hypothetical protein
MTSGIRLVVQGDDMGMSRATNRGVELAATEGVLTQVSMMAPTPWFGEAAQVVRRLGLPMGVHLTLTCEWDFLRWAPLTAAASLRDPDGGFVRTVSDAAAADPDEAIAEAQAQADRVVSHGLQPTYVDPHMGVSVPRAYQALCARFGVRFIYPDVAPHHDVDSITWLSLAPKDDRPAWFADFLDRLEPGTHFVLSHPGDGDEELRAMTSRDAPNAMWAGPVQKADLAALCHPDVRAAVERRGIELVAVRDL